MHTLIISGGNIEDIFAHTYIQAHRFDRVIAADRGLDFCRRSKILPDLILGDFDSAPSAALEYFEQRMPERIRRFPAHKDETDTELAVMEAILQESDEITVLGATGTRLDHVLGNIHLLKLAMEEGISMYLVDAHNRIRMLRQGELLVLNKAEQFGHYVSLIPFTPAVKGLTLEGFAYDVADFTLEAGKSRGVSNELEKEQGTISFTEGILLVIESKD